MKGFNPQKPAPEPRGQINVDIGRDRRDRLRAFCKRNKISITHCVREMVDYCLAKGKGK